MDDIDGFWWGEEQAVYAVNYTVGAENVDGDDAGVEVDGEAFEGDLGGEALGLRAEGFLGVEGGDGPGDEDAAGGVEVRRDMVRKDGFELLL